MPLLFALAGVVALGLSFTVLVGPVLLVVGVARAIRAARSAKSQLPSPEICASPVDGQMAESAFVDMIAREWPEESTALRHRST